MNQVRQAMRSGFGCKLIIKLHARIMRALSLKTYL